MIERARQIKLSVHAKAPPYTREAIRTASLLPSVDIKSCLMKPATRLKRLFATQRKDAPFISCHIIPPHRAGARAVDLGRPMIYQGGGRQSSKISVKIAVFKRVSVLFGGGQACQLALPPSLGASPATTIGKQRIGLARSFYALQ